MRPLIRSLEGKTPKIHPSARIAENAVIIGDVTIGAETSIWYGCILRGDVNSIIIGSHSNIQDGTVIHGQTVGGPTIIGDYVSIGHMALVHAAICHDYSFIGMKSCVMNNAEVPSHTIVGAGAMVPNNKILVAGHVYVGNPAKILREINEKDQQLMDWTHPHYVKLGQRVLPAYSDL